MFEPKPNWYKPFVSVWVWVSKILPETRPSSFWFGKKGLKPNQTELPQHYAPLNYSKVFAQTTLPKGLEGSKTVVQNLDRLHWGLMELKHFITQPTPSGGCSSQSTGHMNPSATASASQSPQVIMSPQTSDTSAPMDIGQHKPQVETHTCYNCNKPGHISPNCPEPRKQHIWNTGTEVNIQELVTKPVSGLQLP